MRFFRLVFRFRWLIIVTAILLTLFFGWQIRHLKINADLTSYLPRTDPAVKTLEHVADTFGGNFLTFVAIEGEDIFIPEILEAIRDLTSRLQLLEGVDYVTSLANILDLKKSEEGLEIGKLLSEEDFPLETTRATGLREYVLSRKRYRGRIISEDGRLALIIVAIRKDADKNQVMEQIEDTVRQRKFPGPIRLAGLPFQLREISRYIIDDLKILSPLVTFVMLLSLYLNFRNWRGVIIPLVAVAMSTLWTLGVMSLARVPLTIISDAIPVLLLAIGSAYSLHVINRFNEAAGHHVERALGHVSKSVTLAAVTTIAGFMSFVFGSYLSAIREFGLFASLGVLFALIMAVTFVPAWLSFTRQRNKTLKKESSSSSAAELHTHPVSWLEQWSFGFLRHEKITLVIFGLVMVVLLCGIPSIERRSNMLDYFPPKSEIRKSEEFLKARIGGSIPIHIVVKGDIQNPAVLREMMAIETFLEQDQVVHNPISIADYLAEMNELIDDEEKIPDTREKVSNLLFLLEGQEGLEQLIMADKTEAVIQATIPSLDIRQMGELVDRIERWIGNRQPGAAEMMFSGSPLVYLHLNRSLLQSQVLSLALALGSIYLCVLLLVRSPRGGLLGMIPIVFTLILVFGLMGYSGIPLDIATVLVGSVSIGIGIDYVLHFLHRFQFEAEGLGRGENQDEPRMAAEKIISQPSSGLIQAVEKTLRTAGRAIFVNMTSVALGFLVLVLANLIPLRRFGLLVAATMLSSGAGALTLLPAVIVRTKARWLVRRGEKVKNKNG